MEKIEIQKGKIHIMAKDLNCSNKGTLSLIFHGSMVTKIQQRRPVTRNSFFDFKELQRMRRQL